MTMSIGRSNSHMETSTGFGRLRLLHQMTPMAVAPLKVADPIAFAGKVTPNDSFQKGINVGASYSQAKAVPSKPGTPLTQQHQLNHPDFMARRNTLEPKVNNPNNPFKLAAGEPAHLTFAAQRHAPTINYFSSKGNNRNNIAPPAKSSSPSFAVIPAIAGIGMLFAQVLGPAVTLWKSGQVFNIISKVNPIPAIKALDGYLKVLIPRM